MTWLLDTNILSELRKGPRCSASVAAWNQSVVVADTFVSVLTIGEIRKGIEQIRRRDSPHAA